MAHFAKTVTTVWSPEQAFAYLSDFSHSAEWDPGVETARRVDAGEIGPGSAFSTSPSGSDGDDCLCATR